MRIKPACATQFEGNINVARFINLLDSRVDDISTKIAKIVGALEAIDFDQATELVNLPPGRMPLVLKDTEAFI